MIATLRSARPFGALFAKSTRHEDPAAQRARLRSMAQLALQVEFSTIPVYLQGMYSIVDRTSEPYQVLRSVVMEEMFHVNVAANLVAALGAQPRFTGDAVPVYPGYLPHANEATTPQIGLFRASPDVFNNVYAAIETPAPAGAPAQPDRYDTIAQLYEAFRDAIQAYPGNPFDPNLGPSPGRQRTDIYLGKFGGTVVEVTDKDTAYHAIRQIVEQGEGRVPGEEQALVPSEPYGAYNHYGPRTDGTYGPIIGTPLELSHFLKFRQIALATAPFPKTYPIISNPELTQFTNPDAVGLARAFNRAYSAMLRNFERSFGNDGDPYFGVVLVLMHQVLPSLAASLMTTPAHGAGDASVGPNAAPTWMYESTADPGGGLADLERLKSSLTPDNPASEPVAQALEGLRSIVALREASAR